MKKNNFLIFLVLLAFFSVKAQVNTYSPYSYFGVGQLHSLSTTSNIVNGGLGVSTYSLYSLNHVNPASISFLDQTSFEIGSITTFINMSQGNLEQRNFVSSLSNIGLGFPILGSSSSNNQLGLSFALLPYSNVGYNVNTEVLIDDYIGLENYNYNGFGGINKFIVGSGWRITNNIAIGANLNYLFGNISRSTEVYTENSIIQFRENHFTLINDINFDCGVLFTKSISDYRINLGFTFSPERQIKSKTNLFQHTYITSGEFETFVDTILDVENTIENMIMPSDYAVGFSIESSSKWLLGIDYKYTNWEKHGQSLSYNYMSDKNELIIGAKFIPKKTDIYNYFNRVQYSLGVSYESGYLDLLRATNTEGVESNVLTDLALTFGMALPMNKVYSKANLGFRYGVRKSENDFLTGDNIDENYLTVYLSMTLNEKWFKKRKIQ